MQRIVGALSGLTVMVATAIFAGDSSDEADARTQQPLAERATPEQIEIANKFLNLLDRLVSQALPEFENVEGVVGDNIVNGAVVHRELSLDEELEEFREMLKPELLFLRKACEPSEAEFRALSRSCEDSLPEIARQFLAEQDEEQNGEQNDEPDGDRRRTVERKPLPQRIQEAIAQAAECQLTPEKWSQYSAELKLRMAHRKRVAILNLVSRLDLDLQLSSSQRGQFEKLLDANWNDAWCRSLGTFAEDSNFMPSFPENDVVSILSPTQRLVFDGLNYNDDTDLWGDGLLDWLIEPGDEPMADEETPADDNASQARNTSESD